ncbi:MAG: hypothetical protein WA888_00730 [Burkholderiaceae bacterium]
MSIRRKNQTRSQWQAIVQQQAASGEPASYWCKANGVGYASFMKWRKQLRDAPASPESIAGFVELTQPPAQPVSTNEVSAWLVELDLAPGIVLRIAQPM